MSDEMENQPKFLTVEEFAAAIQVHPQTVRLWDKTGKLKPHHKTQGGHRMYSDEQVKEYLSNSEV